MDNLDSLLSVLYVCLSVRGVEWDELSTRLAGVTPRGKKKGGQIVELISIWNRGARIVRRDYLYGRASLSGTLPFVSFVSLLLRTHNKPLSRAYYKQDQPCTLSIVSNTLVRLVDPPLRRPPRG
jgi:hypothetical protein